MQNSSQEESKPLPTNPHTPTENGATNQEASESKPKPEKYILLLGPRGCGKSALIDMAANNPKQTLSSANLGSTTEFQTYPGYKINHHTFTLIDSPELAVDDSTSVRETLMKLVKYLTVDPSSPTGLPIRLTGIVYIQPESDILNTQTLREHLQVLKALIGGRQIGCVTILVKPQNETWQDEEISRSLKEPGSPFHIFYSRGRGPRIVVSKFRQGLIRNLLHPYTIFGFRGPLRRLYVLHMMVEEDWSTEDVTQYLQDALNADLEDYPDSTERTRTSPSREEIQDDDHATASNSTPPLEDKDRDTTTHPTPLPVVGYQGLPADAAAPGPMPPLEDKDRGTGIKAHPTPLQETEHQEAPADVTAPGQTLPLEHKDRGTTTHLTPLQGTEYQELPADATTPGPTPSPEDRDRGPTTHPIPLQGTEYQEAPADATNLERQQVKEAGKALDIEARELEFSYKEKFERLKVKHEKIEGEYASLRSHMQIQDNIEDGQIIQAFDDINRLIGELGYSISESLFENHSEAITSIQNLEAPRFRNLADMFGHKEERPSLLKSSSGTYPDLEDFFDYAIRATLCDQLYERLFKPFHPSIAGRDHELQNNFVVEVYRQIVCREPQSVAGRWRRDAFNSISTSSILSGHGYVSTIRQAIADSICALVELFLEHPVVGLFTQEVEKILDKLIAKAEAWNQLVKGSVVFHGDFHPFTSRYGDNFDANYMFEFGAKPNNTNHPEVSLATIELGLIKYYAVGGHQEPEPTVLRKAVIASEKLLFR